VTFLLTHSRLTQRKRQRQSANEKSVKRLATKRLRGFVNGNDLKEAEAGEAEAVGVVETSTGDAPDLHRDETSRLAETTVDLFLDVIWTHTFRLEGETVAKTTVGAESPDHSLVRHLATLLPHLHLLVDGAIVMPARHERERDHPVSPTHRLDEGLEGEGGTPQVVVKIDHGPTHV
jgi:hypothetical protein